jgi:hypothetical protein
MFTIGVMPTVDEPQSARLSTMDTSLSWLFPASIGGSYLCILFRRVGMSKSVFSVVLLPHARHPTFSADWITELGIGRLSHLRPSFRAMTESRRTFTTIGHVSQRAFTKVSAPDLVYQFHFHS